MEILSIKEFKENWDNRKYLYAFFEENEPKFLQKLNELNASENVSGFFLILKSLDPDYNDKILHGNIMGIKKIGIKDDGNILFLELSEDMGISFSYFNNDTNKEIKLDKNKKILEKLLIGINNIEEFIILNNYDKLNNKIMAEDKQVIKSNKI